MKFNKKVIICMIMILSMLLGGCGTSLGSSVKKVKPDPDNPTKVTIWHYYNGDQYIKSAAEVFVESVPENTLISRPGGDEFYIEIFRSARKRYQSSVNTFAKRRPIYAAFVSRSGMVSR